MRFSIVFKLFSLTLAAVLLSFSPTAHAQLQVVFGLDDSGSMGRGSGGTDPDRLSRFATGALIAALDDTVEATILAMSERDGERSGPAMAPLALNRGFLEGLIRAPERSSERGEFWNYDGRDTPCQRLLDGIQQTLNEAYRPDATQVAIFLSDGECTDSVNTRRFLDGLRSEQRAGRAENGPRPFQFYLVCMGQDQSCSPQLAQLARDTGGQAYPVTSSAPRDLVQVFGTALGRSQGVCPTVHSETDNRLLSHPGASSVRLLGFAREGGASAIRFANGTGAEMRTERSVIHHSDARLFRYVSGTMAPNEDVVVLDIEGDRSEGWAIVAVPDYRLRPTLRVLNHDCDQEEDTELGGAASGGQTLCVELRVTGEGDRLVRRDGVGTGMSATLTIEAPAEAGMSGAFPMNASSDGMASFRFSLPRVSDGVYQLSAALTVDMNCTSQMGVDRPEPVTLQSDSRSLTVSTLQASFDVDEVDFGVLGLGASADQRITPGGNFARTEMDFALAGADSLPPCVRLSLNSLPPGSRIWVSSGQAMQLQASVEPFCDWSVGEQTLRTTLTLNDPTGSVPPLLQNISLTLRPVISAPSPSSVAVAAGESGTLQLALNWSTERESLVIAELLDMPQERELELQLVPPAVPVPLPPSLVLPEGAVVYRVPASSSAETGGAIEIPLEARASACCSNGLYDATLALSPMIDGLPGAQRSVPITVTVSDHSWWACNSRNVFLALLAFAAFWVIGFVTRFFSQRHLVPKGIVISANAWCIRDHEPTDDSSGVPAKLIVGETPSTGEEWTRLPNSLQRFAARRRNMNCGWPLGWPGPWFETVEAGRVTIKLQSATFVVSESNRRRLRHIHSVKDGDSAGNLPVGTLVIQAMPRNRCAVFVVVHPDRVESGGDALRRWGEEMVRNHQVPDTHGDSASDAVFNRLNSKLAIRFAESVSNPENSEPYGVLLTLQSPGR